MFQKYSMCYDFFLVLASEHKNVYNNLQVLRDHMDMLASSGFLGMILS